MLTIGPEKNIQIRKKVNKEWVKVYPKTKAELVETDNQNQFISAADKLTIQQNKEQIKVLKNSTPNTDSLKKDITDLKTQLLDASYIKKTGSIITCENSVGGNVKAVKIKGQTFRNICPRFINEISSKPFCWSEDSTSSFYQEYSFSGDNIDKSRTPFKKGQTYTVVCDGEMFRSHDVDDPKKQHPRASYLMFYRANMTTGATEFVASYPVTPKLMPGEKVVNHVSTFTLTEDYGTVNLRVFTADIPKQTSWKATLTNLRIYEGNLTSKDLPTENQGLCSIAENDSKSVTIKGCSKNMFNPFFLREKLDEDGWFKFKDLGNSRTNIHAALYKTTDKEKPLITNIINKSFKTVDQNQYYIYIGLNGDKKDDKVFIPITLKAQTDYFFSCDYEAKKDDIPGDIKINNIQIEQNVSKTSYEPYEECVANVVLPTSSLKSLPDGTHDYVQENRVHKNVQRIVLKGTEKWEFVKSSWNTYVFALKVPDAKAVSETSKTVYSDVFSTICAKENTKAGAEGIWQNNDAAKPCLMIAINRIFLENNSVESFSKWLISHPTVVYYKLNIPLTENLSRDAIVNLRHIRTYPHTTHFTAYSNIRPEIELEVVNNINATIQNNVDMINSLDERLSNLEKINLTLALNIKNIQEQLKHHMEQ